MGKRYPRFSQIVFGYLGNTKGKLSLVSFCTLAFTVAELLEPWPFKFIFDYILLDNPLSPSLSFLDGLLRLGKGTALFWISLSVVGIAVLQASFSYCQVALTSRIGYEIVYTLRRELFAHLQRLSLSFHTRSRAGELLTRVTNEANDLKEIFGETILNFVTHLLILVGMITAMFLLNWQLTVVVLLTLPVLFYALAQLFWKIKAAAKIQRTKEGEIASRISESLASVRLVQAFGREKYEEQAIDAQSTQTLEDSVHTARMEAVASRVVRIIGAIGTWAVILIGSWQVLETHMTPGDMLIFWAYVGKMYKPIASLVRLSTKFTRALVSVERINEVLEVEPDIQDAPDAIAATSLRGEIVFDNVSFDYGDGKEVLKQASFAIAPGQRVALVGPSGAGKSTVVCLLLRLIDAQEGAVVIDGVDVKKYRRESLRHQIGVVLQESILFGASIRENIAYGKPGATFDEIVAAAKAANADEFILELEAGYDTVIGERGATLSGGQRQRLAIARTLIRNAPILILDEPMTGLDVVSEAKVREALQRLMAGKTCLTITHDLEAAAESDLVLVLDEGRIVQCGDPAALAKGSGGSAGSAAGYTNRTVVESTHNDAGYGARTLIAAGRSLP